MEKNPTIAVKDSDDEVAALMRTLRETQRRLQELTGSAVDTLIEPNGQYFLLHDAQIKLQESNEKFHQLADNITDAFWIRSPDLRELHYISPAFETIWGRSVESLYANPQQWIDFALPEDRERVLSAFAELMASAPMLDIEYRIVRPDGEVRWIHTRGFQVRNAVGELIRLTGIVTDITERKRTDSLLRYEEALNKDILNTIPTGVYRLRMRPAEMWNEDNWRRQMELNYSFDMVSDRFCEITGINRDESANPTVLPDRIHPDDSPGFVRKNAEAVVSLSLFSWEGRIMLPDKRTTWIHLESTPRLLENKDVIWTGIVYDITERKRAEEAMLQRVKLQDQLAYIASSVPGMIYSLHMSPDGSTRMPYASGALMDIFELQPKDVIENAAAIFSLVHPDDIGHVQETIAESARTMNHWRDEFRVCNTRLGEIWVEGHSVPQREPDGSILWHGFVQNITERKQNEESIRKLSVAVEQSPASIIITDVHGNIEYVNPKFSQVTGYSFEEAMGNNPRILKSGQQTSEAYQLLWSTITSGKEWRGELHNKKKNGELYWEQASISPIVDLQGNITNFLAIKEDITERKRAEDLLQLQAQELEESNTNLRASELIAKEQNESLQIQAYELIAAREVALEGLRLKSEFIANVTHELRTPMNGIMGVTGLLLDTDLDDEQRELTEMVRTSGNSLLMVINDILDFSSLDTGRLSLEVEDQDLVSVVKAAISQLSPRAMEKGLALECQLDSAPLHALRCDSLRVRQVMMNLVGNAIKFTEEGEVRVRVTVEEETEKNVSVRFAVSDTGIGIPEEMKNRLFIPFSQVDGSSTRKYGGTGLGLAISKKLVEMMGGTIGADSKGKGSRFWWTATFEKQHAGVEPTRRALADTLGATTENVRTPLRQSGTVHTSGPNVDELHGQLRILVAEDNLVNQKLFVRVLEKLGYRPDVVSNGAEAVSANSRNPYDIIFMDCQMPVMDGFEATAQIRMTDTPGNRTTIIAVTANVMDGDKEKCLAAGMDDFLSKPILQSDFVAAIDRWSLRAAVVEHELLVDEKVLYGLQELADEDDPDFVAQLLEMFLRDCPASLDQIRHAARGGDSEAVRTTAHALKGACEQIGLTAMATLCRYIEDRTEANTLHGIEHSVSELETTLQKTKEILESKHLS